MCDSLQNPFISLHWSLIMMIKWLNLRKTSQIYKAANVLNWTLTDFGCFLPAHFRQVVWRHCETMGPTWLGFWVGVIFGSLVYLILASSLILKVTGTRFYSRQFPQFILLWCYCWLQLKFIILHNFHEISDTFFMEWIFHITGGFKSIDCTHEMNMA